MNRTRQLAEQFDHTGARFIMVELDLAITFCKIGLAARTVLRAARNAANAQLALQAVARIRKRIRPTDAEEHEIVDKTSSLESLLKQLKMRLASWK
jgi:hypothetical protein